MLLVAGLLPAAPAARAETEFVVAISMDGLKPRYYLDDGYLSAMPTLRRLMAQGSCVERVLPAYPSVTYVCHASISTGTRPARHGIYANNAFDPTGARGDPGLWYAREIQRPALWDAASRARRTVAAISWPTTAGAKSINWCLPEFWTTALGSERTQISRYATPEVLAMLRNAGRALEHAYVDQMAPRDSYMTAAAVELIRWHRPNLLLVHLLDVDHQGHAEGLDRATISESLARLDRHLAEIVGATRAAGIQDRTAFLVFGDHGFAPVRYTLNPNPLFVEAGLIRLRGKQVESWDAFVQNTGGSAAVHLRDPADLALRHRVLRILEDHRRGPDGQPLFDVLDREELARIGGPTAPSFYLEGAPGYMFSSSTSSKTFIRASNLKANHGWLPTKPEMATGLVAWGAGIRRGVVIPEASLVDIAPTIARLLDFPMPDVDGRPLLPLLAK